jgi:hypothetical protein
VRKIVDKESSQSLNDKQRWEMVDMAISAFLKRYPEACELFFKEINSYRSEFGLVEDKELRKSNSRLTLSFPIVRNENGDDDSLMPILNRYLPGFTKRTHPYYKEFIKRYPKFSAMASWKKL